jgi:hypothetical protein
MKDIIESIVDGIERRDHKKALVCAGNEDAVFDEMEAAGYVFAFARAADEFGLRAVYFVPGERAPGLRM